ncbi:NAD-dependent epimerase/dehydratase family protein [Paenibacillus kandeliae]|uniref:NAD-dependent epimerase/dehydratase family protein n=1 Tax=Paenibacillus kandeliae TaxID=3231269 RepID=UPI00345A6438
MTVLIIGAGLIGSHIAKSCLSSGNCVRMVGFHLEHEYIHNISGLSRECMIDMAISSKEQVYTLLQEYAIETVIIAAGSMHQTFQKHTGAAIANEARLLMSIYEACLMKPPKQLIYISSLAVYGSGRERSEDQLPIPVSAYGISKLYSEQLIGRLSQQTNTSVHILRPAGVLGPNPSTSGNWMSTAINQLFIKDDPNLSSSIQWKQEIECTDVRDLAGFVAELLQSNLVNPESSIEILNIGSGKMLSAEQLMYELKCFFRLPVQSESITFATSQALPIEKANTLYGYVPAYTFADSLMYIAQYYGRDYANNQKANTVQLGGNVK